MDTHTLEISSPCPVDLDIDRSARQFFCGHCQKDVHVLANWSRAEAEAFIAANRGNSVCISLRRDSRGELLYADSPRPAPIVPVARLRRRWLPEAAAAAGVVAALSACAPHLPPKDLGSQADEDEVVVPAVAGGITVPDAFVPPPAVEVVEDGGIAIPEPVIERGEKPAIEQPPARARGEKPRAKKPKEEPLEEEEFLAGGISL